MAVGRALAALASRRPDVGGVCRGLEIIATGKDSQSVPVTFGPTSVGEQSDAALQLETNNPDPTKFTVDLSGSGIENNLTSVGSTADFGSVEISEQATTDAGFENVGEVETTITNASITGSDQFNVDTTSLPLPVTDTNSLPVTFSPTGDGEMTGTQR